MESSTKTTRTLCKNVCVPTSMILVLVLSELVFPVMALVEQLKRLVAKRSLQRSLNYQILDYKAILDLCENEMMSIKFLGFIRRAFSVLRVFRMRNDMKVGTLYLSHGVVTILLNCHPRELVLS